MIAYAFSPVHSPVQLSTVHLEIAWVNSRSDIFVANATFWVSLQLLLRQNSLQKN